MKKIRYITVFLFLGLALTNLSTKASAIDSLLNVSYGKGKTYKGNQQNLTLDLFFPKQEAGKKYPLVMLMHGGGFANGSKEAMKAHCKILADSGFIAVSINYRKGWDRGANAFGCEGNIQQLQEAVYRATQDAHAALRFLVEKQAEYAIDTAWIFAGGSSAGGVMALNLAYLTQKSVQRLFPGAAASLGELTNASNTIRQNFSIKGICNLWGALPDSSLVTPQNALPSIFYHGTKDMVVPYDQGKFGSICENYPVMFGSACIFRRTVAAGKPARLHIAEGGNHGPKQFYAKITMSNTACFFKQVMQGTATGAKTFTNAKAGCR